MSLKTDTYKCHNNRPTIILIHGLGVDKNIWINPTETKIMAGQFPIATILGKKPEQIDLGFRKKKPKEDVPKFSFGERTGTLRTLFHDLKQKGYSVVTWSQRRPAAPMDDVVRELKEVVEETRTYSKNGIILISHSRGGLVARKYLMKKDRSIRGLVTIATPHEGSSLAKFGKYLSPLARLLIPLFPDEERGMVSRAIKRISEFLRSEALKELLPESPWIRSLQDKPCEWVSYVSIGGTNPSLFNFYRWEMDAVTEGDYQRWFLRPRKLFSIPDSFEKVVPSNLYPDEMKKGKGDGLVSAESSRIPWGSEHHMFNLNHAELLFDKKVRETVMKAIEEMTK
jgi:pimeloyl-ACP methyl ester carboxylesterase